MLTRSVFSFVLVIGLLFLRAEYAGAQRVSLNVELGSTNASLSPAFVNSGAFVAALGVSAQPFHGTNVSWVLSGQIFAAPPSGSDAVCVQGNGIPNCGNINVLPVLSALSGVQLDLKGTALRLLGGGTIYQEEFRGARPVPTVRADLAFPAKQTFSFTASLTHSRFGAFYGNRLQMTTLSGGLRLKRK